MPDDGRTTLHVGVPVSWWINDVDDLWLVDVGAPGTRSAARASVRLGSPSLQRSSGGDRTHKTSCKHCWNWPANNFVPSCLRWIYEHDVQLERFAGHLHDGLLASWNTYLRARQWAADCMATEQRHDVATSWRTAGTAAAREGGEKSNLLHEGFSKLGALLTVVLVCLAQGVGRYI